MINHNHFTCSNKCCEILKMEQEQPIFQGFLLLPPVGKLLLKKAWQQKHCLLFKASKFGIERLEVYDAADAKEAKLITLENCIKLHSKSPTIFCVTTKTAVHEFGTLNEQGLNDWLKAIQSVAFPDEVSNLSVEEDNELYCSSGGGGIFNVKLHPSPASERCGLGDGNFILVLTSTAIQLRNIIDDKLLFTWPYCYIRRYGFKSEKFTFEAGRMCKSGEGKFFFEHTDHLEILRCLESKMQALKKLQFKTALIMKPRSRTPLPPSPTYPALEDLNLSYKSQLNLSDTDHSMQSMKHTPAKPPRKYLPIKQPTETAEIDCNYETVEKYDDIEYRSNAWQTLGVDDPNHTEQVNKQEEEKYYISWGGRDKKEIETLKPTAQPLAPKIITQNSMTDLSGSEYDKLNFFGSSSKLNVKSVYKQVPTHSAVPVPQPPSFNDYDEVQCLDMEPVRPADDSHLGYALIRKEPGKDSLRPVVKNRKEMDLVGHHFQNDEPYAVISKPKRV